MWAIGLITQQCRRMSGGKVAAADLWKLSVRIQFAPRNRRAAHKRVIYNGCLKAADMQVRIALLNYVSHTHTRSGR